MKRLAIIFALCLPLMNGCAATHDLSKEYDPLTTVSERPWYASWIGGSESLITTVGDTAYVKDLDVWLEARPVDSPRYRNVLMHERVHSYRQSQRVLAGWLKDYLTNPEFQWYEEQLGWFVQIRLNMRTGVRMNSQGIAKILSGYKPKMVEYEDALKWVRDVMSGRWQPKKGELPPDLEKELNVR